MTKRLDIVCAVVAGALLVLVVVGYFYVTAKGGALAQPPWYINPHSTFLYTTVSIIIGIVALIIAAVATWLHRRRQ
mgnify:CR=1 FL=1